MPELEVNPWLIAIAVMLGTFMEVLDTTVVNVSLPHIAGNLSATVDEATWVLTSYLVSNAIVLPMTGWLANYFGRKRILLLSVTGFTIFSVACGLATSLSMLIVFRVLQGACGGGLQPLSQAILLEAFPPEERGKAMAFWGLGIVVAPMLGPVLGGWITDSYSWRWLFYINLPVGVAAVLMSKLYVHDPAYIRRTASRVDVWGIGLLAVGIGSLQVLLDKGQQEDWFGSHFITALAVICVVSLIVFVIVELKTRYPIVDLRVLKVPTYATGVFLMTVVGFVLYGSIVMIPIWLQTLMGYPALQAGFALLPRGLGSFIFMPLVGILMSRVESRKLLAVGLVLAGYSLILLSDLNLSAGYWDIFWPQIILGIALSMLFVPLTTVTHSPIPREQMGNATSIFNLMRNVGGSLGIAIVTTMVARQSQANINVLGANVNAFSPGARTMFENLRQMFQSQGMDFATATRQAYAALFGMVERQASMISYANIFFFMGIIFLVVLPLLLLMRRPKAGGAPVAMH
jgi:DHA2 family multidrug resistance protein